MVSTSDIVPREMVSFGVLLLWFDASWNLWFNYLLIVTDALDTCDWSVGHLWLT